ncbi:F-box only protein 43 isoform X1 [Osmerus mordax]|uniref:F-box only protein 43 isoform X1 n=2 Tax=Osmerus mordax TaxID=8014 RepID=UPI0035103562
MGDPEKRMEHNMGSDVQFQTSKSKHYGSSSDSGYLDSFHSPEMKTGLKCDPSLSFCEDGFHETPKENFLQRREPRLSLTPKKEKDREPVRCLEKELRKEQPVVTGWCETPKVSKRDASLRRRLLISQSVTEGKTELTGTQCTRKTGPSVNVRSQRISSNVFLYSPESRLMGALATSTLRPEELPLSGRKRRLMFSHVKTSTLEDGNCNVANLPRFEKRGSESLTDTDLDESIISSDCLTTDMLETPCHAKFLSVVKGSFETPINLAANLSESLSVLSTPSSATPNPKLDTSMSEDSGFNSLALDKSHDSSVDHDGSFQDLLPSSTGKETPRLAELKRRSRLERQRRLSTLKEGGSQSEEEARATSKTLRGKTQTDQGQQQPQPRGSLSKEDEVFLQVTPLRTETSRLEDLSLTPALQMVRAMSLRTAGILPEQTSLEELLRASNTPEPFRTTMPLAGLIGRKIGLEKVDVFTELKKRNLRHILSMVLKQLSPEDIYRFSQVCTSWNCIIQQDKMATRRRKLYLKEVKMALELGSATHVPDAETRLNLLNRSALRSVQAQSTTPSTRTPQSAHSTGTPVQHNTSYSSSKRDKFLQVAKTLFNDECLKACPRCQHPARCHSVKREGVCSTADCGFQFCTACLCAFHGSKDCESLSAHRRMKKDVLPGSAQSKRNLRRL